MLKYHRNFFTGYFLMDYLLLHAVVDSYECEFFIRFPRVHEFFKLGYS